MAESPRSIVILQPMYFPWIGHLEQVRLADVYVHYDDVQFSNGSLVNRVKIKTARGPRWITAPVARRGLQPINRVEIHEADPDWRNRQMRVFAEAYEGAPHRSDALDLLHTTLACDATSIGALSIASIEALADYFGLETRFERSSTLSIPGRSTQRVVDLTRHFGGRAYLTGHGARNYLDHGAFAPHGIEVRYMDYERATYPQLHGAFDPHVSSLDLVANCGRDGIEFIRSGTTPWQDFVTASSTT